MGNPHRIAAGGIIFKGNAVLLVRYPAKDGKKTFLVGPGGGLEDDENIIQAVIRETKEETGVMVEPKRVVIIEDLIDSRCKMIKIWMVCEYGSGKVHKTREAEKEGIMETAWFTKEQLANEKVYPALLMESDWKQLRMKNWEIKILPSRVMNSEG